MADMTGGNGRIAALRAAAVVAPADHLIRRLLAEALEDAGRWQEAVTERRELVAANPADPAAKVALARAFAEAGNRGAAEVILDELEGAGETTVEAWRLRGRLLGLDAGPGDPNPTEPASPSASPAGRPEPSLIEADGGRRDELLELPGVTFADVGGMDKLKEEIELKIIHPLTHGDLYAAYGKRAGGRRHLDVRSAGVRQDVPRACDRRRDPRRFLAVGIHEVLDMWIGDSERNLHCIFERRVATDRACCSSTRSTRSARGAGT